MKHYADIIIKTTTMEIDKPFTYIIGEDILSQLQVGMRVLVPFGQGNRTNIGIVVAIKNEYKGKYRLKEIIDILDDRPLISQKLLNLSKWISEYYISSYYDAINLVLPPGDYKKIHRIINYNRLNYSHLEDRILLRIMDIVAEEESINLNELKLKLGLDNINPYLRELREEGLISIRLNIVDNITIKTEKWVYIDKRDKDYAHEKIGTRAKKQKEVYDFLYNLEGLSLKELLRTINTSSSTVKELEKKKLLAIEDRQVERNPIDKNILSYPKHDLNLEQSQVLNTIMNGENNKFLIHGITGSGKTEIYLQMVEQMLNLGKDSIILVPEISLTPQTTNRFVGRFKEKVAILHSGLSLGERFDQWRQIEEGRVKIVIGARSAVFAPFKNLGLIVIDEEHESTYKSSQNPKYDTREVAEKRVELEEANLILGSATPSIESYYKAQSGYYKLLELNERANKQQLPKVEIVDMKNELLNGNRSIFSASLYNNILGALEENKQVILFLNRRGFTTFVSCRSCGYTVRCDDCDVSMTYHKNINRLKCHYCGDTKANPNICPACGSNYIKHFGIGTEQVEDLTKKAFPAAKVARMDADTMTKKNSYKETLDRMARGEIDILIGTQMISKGLDFKNVTLVGIIAADTTINLPDFRSPERSFQLVTQVAGRAGRGDELGKVILQTYQPDHYSLSYAREHDYTGFYATEISLRKAFNYPPYTNIVKILLYGEDRYMVERSIAHIASLLEKGLYDKINLESDFIGPFPSPLERIRNNFRYQIIIKASRENFREIKEIIKNECLINKNIDYNKIRISIDIDPISIL